MNFGRSRGDDEAGVFLSRQALTEGWELTRIQHGRLLLNIYGYKQQYNFND